MARIITGIVSSDKADKTIVITVQSRKTHPLYRKQYTQSTKYMAHDEKNEAKVGDSVSIIECRPISAKKRFKLNKIINHTKLTEESLAAVKVDDSGHKASKAKTKDETEAVKTPPQEAKK